MSTVNPDTTISDLAVRFPAAARVFIEPKWLDPAGLGPAFRSDAVPLGRLRNSLFHLPPKAAEKA